MNVLEIRNSLIEYWQDNFTSCPTLYENVTLPDTLKKNPFTVFEIEFLESKTVGSGTPEGTKTRHRGLIVVSVNVPKGSGNKTSYTLANEAITLLERKRINQSVATYSGYIDKNNSGYDEEHYSLVIIVPFIVTIG